MKGNWKHGLQRRGKQHPLFKTWCEMRYRCENPKKHNYAYYGGRGIKVCERWHDFSKFVEDMGEKPDGSTLDRIDLNGNYEPSNCRWATKRQQMRNMSTNRLLTYCGETLTLTEWSERTGIKVGTIWARLDVYGWPVEKALRERRTQSSNLRAMGG